MIYDPRGMAVGLRNLALHYRNSNHKPEQMGFTHNPFWRL